VVHGPIIRYNLGYELEQPDDEKSESIGNTQKCYVDQTENVEKLADKKKVENWSSVGVHGENGDSIACERRVRHCRALQ